MVEQNIISLEKIRDIIGKYEMGMYLENLQNELRVSESELIESILYHIEKDMFCLFLTMIPVWRTKRKEYLFRGQSRNYITV